MDSHDEVIQPKQQDLLQDVLDQAPVCDTAPSDKIRWPRTEQIMIFRELMSEKGLRSTHRLGWTAALDARSITDPKIKRLTELVSMRYPRLIMRWRKDDLNNTYLRLALILDQAHVALPDWPELKVYFAYGLTKGDPTLTAPVGDGLKHFYHGSPHVIHSSFKVKRYKGDAGELVPAGEVARIDNDDQYFATYFWVDFKLPELWTLDNLRVAVDAMVELAGTYTEKMNKSVQPGTPLHTKVIEHVYHGIAKVVKTTAKKKIIRRKIYLAPVNNLEIARKIFQRDPEKTKPALQRVAAWAIRKNNVPILDKIRKLGVELGCRELKKYGSVVGALIALRIAHELGDEEVNVSE